jgi:hypothetical protein
MLRDNLEKWSNDLHCVVQLLKKIPQTEENDKCAQECIEDEQRETLAPDTRIAREDDNDPSDEMEVEIDTSEKTNANNQEKGPKK